MSDVRLDDGEQVTVLCNNLNVTGHDLLLDSSARRVPDGRRHRRALVHDLNDSLTVNFGGDYPGGLRLNGVTELRPLGKLVVRGGASYESKGVTLEGEQVTMTIDVDEQFSKLQSQITALAARLAALEQG